MNEIRNLTPFLLNPDISSLKKQCRSGQAAFWRSHLTRIHNVCNHTIESVVMTAWKTHSNLCCRKKKSTFLPTYTHLPTHPSTHPPIHLHVSIYLPTRRLSVCLYPQVIRNYTIMYLIAKYRLVYDLRPPHT